jgi:hypothetical protein
MADDFWGSKRILGYVENITLYLSVSRDKKHILFFSKATFYINLLPFFLFCFLFFFLFHVNPHGFVLFRSNNNTPIIRIISISFDELEIEVKSH